MKARKALKKMLTISVAFAVLMPFCACEKGETRIMDAQTWEQSFSTGITEIRDTAQNRARYLENNMIMTEEGAFQSDNQNGVQGLYYIGENGQTALLQKGYFANLQMQGEFLYAVDIGATHNDKPILYRFNLRDNTMCPFGDKIQYGYVFSDGHVLYVYNQKVYYSDWENENVTQLFEDGSAMTILGEDDRVLLVDKWQGNAFLFTQAEGLKTFWTINAECCFSDLRDGVIYLGKREEIEFRLTAVTVDGTVLLNDEPVPVGGVRSMKYGFHYYLLTSTQLKALERSSCDIISDHRLSNGMHFICVDTNRGNIHCYLYLFEDRIYYNGVSYSLGVVP